MSSRSWIRVLFALPIAVLAGAFVWLAADHRSIALWNVAVHESGRYTLGQTIFYFSHFLREIPTVIVMSLFLAASSAPASRGGGHSNVPSGVSIWSIVGFAGAGLIVALSFAVAVREHGAHEAWLNLSQLYTRDDLPSPGSHWRFHFLSTLWFGLAVQVVTWIGAVLSDGPPPARPLASTAGRIAWLSFALATVAFGITTEPLVDPRFIGHEARELFTHALTTLPLGLGLVALLHQTRGPRQAAGARRPSAVAIIGVLAIPIYLFVAMRLTDSLSAGQTEHGLAAMVAAHFFEHSLDYLLAACLVVGIAALPGRRHSAADRG